MLRFYIPAFRSNSVSNTCTGFPNPITILTVSSFFPSHIFLSSSITTSPPALQLYTRVIFLHCYRHNHPNHLLMKTSANLANLWQREVWRCELAMVQRFLPAIKWWEYSGKVSTPLLSLWLFRTKETGLYIFTDTACTVNIKHHWKKREWQTCTVMKVPSFCSTRLPPH